MTFTSTRSQLQQALADCLEFDQIKSEYESFADLADAMIQAGHFNVAPDAVRVKTVEASPRPGLSAALQARAEEAGAALGKWAFTADGYLAGLPVRPPRKARMGALAAEGRVPR